MMLASFGGPNRFQWSLKTMPYWSIIDVNPVLAWRNGEYVFKYVFVPIWDGFGKSFWNQNRNRKPLESLLNTKRDLILFRAWFWIHFKWFLRHHRTSEGRNGAISKDWSIANSPKLLIFLRKNTTFTSSIDLISTQKRISYPVGKRLDKEMQERCEKKGFWTSVDIDFGAQKQTKNSSDRPSLDIIISKFLS